MDKASAYRKGWDASKRSISCDLEAAEDRFTNRYGFTFHSAFVAGWTDYASDNGYNDGKRDQ